MSATGPRVVTGRRVRPGRRAGRPARFAVVAALILAGGGCADGAPAHRPAAPGAAATGGVTEVSDIFGPACRRLPPSGPGSPPSMRDQPVGTATAGGPLVGALAAAVREAGLVETLDDAPALTVLAPSDEAFAALPQARRDALRDDPQMLRELVRNHLVSTRYDAEGLVGVGVVRTLAGEPVTVAGTADAPVFAGSGDPTPARTLCGDIPTRNATVFVIDRVLLPADGSVPATTAEEPVPAQ